MPMIAGVLDLADVMKRLAVRRPVFHSEADFQLALGMLLHDLDPTLQIRMEIRLSIVAGEKAEYLDVLCWGPAGRTALELKYFKAAWSGVDPQSGEQFRLSSGGADDVARRDFVFDVARLERFCRTSPEPMNGLAIEISNHSALWRPPRPRAIPPRDIQFRIHHGQMLSGELRWGGATEYLANRRTLSGQYVMDWRPYSQLDGKNGEFVWLAVAIETDPQQLPV